MFIRLLTVLFCLQLSPIWGARLVVLGDSLSDGGYYFGYRLTNGTLWHEYLADRLGYERATTAGFLGSQGLNLAIAASLVSDLQSQINRLANRYNRQAGDLCTLWIGGNDVRNNPNQNMTLLAAEIGSIIGQLDALGIDHILVPNLPDLGAIPEEPTGTYTRAERTTGTIAFNTALKAELEARALTHSITIEQLDIFGLFDEMLFYAADYGFNNVSDPWNNSSDDPTGYAFWDDIHPTTRAHFLISGAALPLIETTAPIELISQSIEVDGSLRQTWLADPDASYQVLSGAQIGELNKVDNFQGSPAYTVQIPGPSILSGFFQTRKD